VLEGRNEQGNKSIGPSIIDSSAGGDERIFEKDAHRGPLSAHQFLRYNLRGGKYQTISS